MPHSRSSWISLLSALLLTVALVVAPSRPTFAVETLVVINQIDLDRFPEVTVFFTAVDSAGVPIANLGKDRVQLLHNGGSVPEFALDRAESQQDGLAVAVAVDTSGSMQGRPLETAREAVRLLLDRMGPRDRGAIVSFGQTTQVVQDLTGDRDALHRALDSLVARGDTTLYDGTFQAIALAAQHTLGRRAVVVITDGEDTHSSLTLDDTIGKARETNTPVSVIGLGEVKLEPVQRLTLVTGGSLSVAPGPEQLAERVSQMSERLRQQYVLRYQAPDSRPPENEIELVVNQDGQQVRTAQRFPAPPMPPAAAVAPQVTVKLPSGPDVSGVVNLQAEIESAVPVTGVVWTVDGNPIGTATQPPYEIAWDTTGLPPGEHTVTVQAQDERGAVGQASQTVRVQQASPGGSPSPSPSPGAPGSPVAGVTGSPGAGTTAKPGGTPTPSRTATATPTGSSDEGIFEKVSPAVWIGIAVVGAVVVGIIVMASRKRDNSVVEGSAYRPGLDGPGAPVGSQRALPGAPHGGPGSPRFNVREAETQQASVLPANFAGPAGAPGQSTVTVSIPGTPPRVWPLGVDQFVGRAPGPGVIVIADPQVSRRHARISWEDGHFVYRDLGPMNPTRRDGRTLPNPYILRSGDTLRVGHAELIFRA